MEKYCTNCGAKLNEETNFCSNCGKIINNFNDNQNQQNLLNNKTKFEIINFISIGFSTLLFLFTIYLLFLRYNTYNYNDPECLICGFSVLCNLLIIPNFNNIYNKSYN